MAQKTIFPQGTVEVTVPAAQSIAISNYGGGVAKIYYLIEDANRPDAYQFQQNLNDSSVILGAFSVATVVKIEAGNSKVFYDVAVSPDTGIGDADTLNGKASDTGDTADTIAARDADGDLTANAFESTVVTGTAPLTVASITKVANLNADLLDDLNTATASTASTVAVRDASANLTANVLVSDVAIGTAPLTVTSTTKVTNLNADLLDDLNSATASTASTIAARDAGGDLTANAFISTVATGTAPLTVASTTVVTNLNADLLDGISSASLLRSDAADNVDGVLTFTAGPVLNNTIALSIKESGGTAREVLSVDGSNVMQVGNTSIATNIRSNGTVTVPAANVYLDNNKYYYGADTGAANKALIGVDSGDLIRVGDLSMTMQLRTDGGLYAAGSDFYIDNNRYIVLDDSSNSPHDALGIDGSNVMQVGNTSIATNIQSNGTLTYNGASLATGSIDTTAAQTITVVDGLITSIA
jgi:hypothetical protein